MALLASSWLIIESFIIPHGFLKWFYLSFYIHPSFLVFCQIFLWLKELQIWILILFSFPFRIICCLILSIFRFLNRIFIYLFSLITKPTEVEVFHDAIEEEIIPHRIPTQDCEIAVFSYSSSSKWNSITCQIVDKTRLQTAEVFDVVNESKVGSSLDACTNEDSWLNEYLSSDHFTSSLDLLTYDDLDTTDDQDRCSSSFRGSFIDQDVEVQLQDHDIHTCSSPSIINQEFIQDQLLDIEYLPEFCCSSSPVRVVEQHLTSRIVQEDDEDPFHQKYTERMRFFDILYNERLYGMNAILNEHLTIPGLFKRPELSADLSMQCMSWSKMARKRLLRSLECDFELIYVAQMCLFWEALFHQYQKIEGSGNKLFHHNVSGKFQELQILLERFVEDQKSEGQRHSNNVQKRLSFQCLLRVPDVTGFMEVENNSMSGENIRAAQVLEAIEKCMKAFWLYVQTDNKKSLWKYKGIWRTHPPVEDPKDLELLYNVSRALHKKELMLKDLQGKNKCWLRRKVKPLQAEDEKINLLFAMTDIKLVHRLLQMSLISTSQLKWCQDKLRNFEFRQGNVFRGSTNHLFPSF